MVDYIYDHYDNFRLLLKCGDSGKFESFIHNMVEQEMKSSRKYIEKMKENGGKNTGCRGKPYAHDLYGIFFFIRISDY